MNLLSSHVIACLLLAAAAGAGEVVVTAAMPWNDRDGCSPLIVRVEAVGRPLEVRIEGTLASGSASDVVALRPGQPVVRTLLLPSSNGYGGARLRWSTDAESGSDSIGALIEHRSVDLVALDPAEELPVPALNKLISDGISSGGQARGGWNSRGADRVHRLHADQLPDRWQAWPAWLTLVTTPAGEAALTPAQREAIATWTRAGGALFATSAADAEAWRKLGAVAQYIEGGDPEQRLLMARLRSANDETGSPAAHPVPGTSQVPTAWFICLAIAFAAIAGPLNLWWARRHGAPHLLLITTPLLSLGACVLLVAVALVSDGIGRKRCAVQVAILDAPAQRALLCTAATYFCGISPGRFAIDPEDRLVTMDEADFNGRNRRSQPDIRLAWAGTPMAEGAWIPARVNRQLAWTQARPERRRIVATPTAGGWSIGNGLGVAVRALRWVDPQGVAWETGAIEAGASVQAARTEAAVDRDLAAALKRCGPDARLAAAGMGDRPGTFSARLAAPMQAIPGPAAEDAEPLAAWAIGQPAIAPAGAGGF